MKTYILKPTMTLKTISSASDLLKSPDRHDPRDPANLQAKQITEAIVPAPKPSQGLGVSLPPRQPLPKPLIDPHKPLIKLGLDVHLNFIMVVAQKGHATPMPPRKFSSSELRQQIQRWSAEGFQAFCIQESCGFGFVLHRELVQAGPGPRSRPRCRPRRSAPWRR